MKRILLSLMLASSALAGPVEEVANAEIAFAKAFADRDPAKFFAMVAPDATFLGFRALRGREAVTAGWSRLLQEPQAPFSWGPERVEVTAEGKLGLSTGPIYNAKGFHTGDYSSVWQKQGDGSWKVIFDGPGSGPAQAGKIEEGFVNADDGTKLYYRKFGSGPVTMIVPLDYMLHEHFKQFANMATIVTYDLRNRGRSERAKDESTWTIQQDVRDLEAVRRELKIDNFIPVGFSYLGLMVALYTLDHPGRVTRIVQLGPAPFQKMPDPPQDAQRPDLPRIDPALPQKEQCEIFWNAFKHVLIGNPANVSRFDMSFCTLENEQPANFGRTVAHIMQSVEKLTVTPEQLQAIKVPVLTIHGDKDRNAPYAAGVAWANTLPDAKLVTVKGAAHAAWLDDPVTVWASLRHFLRGEWPLGAQ